MMEATIDKRLVDKILIAEKYPTIKKVGVFGSYARGSTHQGSDIDLLYDYDDSEQQSTDELLEYIEEINERLIAYTKVDKIDYVWYKGVMESSNSAFRDAVLRDVIWLYHR